MRPILAIDIGTKTGWCRSELEAGTEDFSIRRGESAGMRLVRFRGWLEEITRSWVSEVGTPPKGTVVYEEVLFFRGIDASLVYGGLLGILQEHCTTSNIDYTGVKPSELKKWATGKGNATKEVMMAAAALRWPFFRGNDDEADARLLWQMAQERFK